MLGTTSCSFYKLSNNNSLGTTVSVWALEFQMKFSRSETQELYKVDDLADIQQTGLKWQKLTSNQCSGLVLTFSLIYLSQINASFGAVLNNSPQRHSIIILPPEEWVVGLKEKEILEHLHPFHQQLHNWKQSDKHHSKKTHCFCLGHLSQTNFTYFSSRTPRHTLLCQYNQYFAL